MSFLGTIVNKERNIMLKKVKYVSMLIIAILLCVVGFDMHRLTQAQGFWGHRPMFFLILLTALITLLRSRFFYGNEWRVRWTTLSTLSAVLLYFGFPTMPFTPLLFVGFVPLLMVENEISRQAEKPFWKIALYAYHTFLVWNILSTFWVSNSSLGGGIFANFVNAALMTIPFMLYSFCKRYLKSNLHTWAFVAFWIVYEKVDQYWELTWTWLTIGNGFAQYPSWVQWYEYTGVFGGTFWVLLVNYTLYKTIQKYELWNLRWKHLQGPIAMVVVPIVISLGMYFTHQEKGLDKKVLVIQPNYEPHYQKFSVDRTVQYNKMLAQIKSKIDVETDYVLMPETVIRGVNLRDGDRHTYLNKLKRELKEYPNVKIVSGVSAYIQTRDSLEIPKKSRRTRVVRGATSYIEAYNAAVQVSNDIDTIQYYKKSILVPGTEIFPYAQLFFFMEGFIKSMGGTVAGNGTQAERDVFWDAAKEYAVAPVICYESIYGEYCAEYVRKGANALFILTNDGWWDDSPGFRQHLKFASLRAIETRRAIARSANTGSSCYINQRGDILEATEYEVDAVLQSKIKFNNEITFYTKWGDFIARISGLLAILLLLNSIVHRVTKR